MVMVSMSQRTLSTGLPLLSVGANLGSMTTLTKEDLLTVFYNLVNKVGLDASILILEGERKKVQEAIQEAVPPKRHLRLVK